MLKSVIKNSPGIIRFPAAKIYYSIPDYFKYGSTFRATYSFLQKSQWWSREKHLEYQMEKMKGIINYAYDNVPYYTRTFNEYGINPLQVQDFNDVKRIPFLTKQIVISRADELVSKRYDKKKLYYTTSGGTTGIPMGFYQYARNENPMERAHVANLFSRVGYRIKENQSSIILRGNIVKDGFYDVKGKELILSSFKMTQANMMKYIEIIKEYKADFIQAYPSTISTLAKYILENELDVRTYTLKAIICASENLYDFQRQMIEKAFAARVYSFYGHTEHGCIAGECEKNSMYHIQPEYGYTEIVDADGNHIVEEDGIGEIVCTGFINYAFPFIRYKTQDMAVNTDRICPCGRNYKLIKRIYGREQEYLVDKSGSKITFTCSDEVLWDIKDKIYSYQYVQEMPGKVVLFIHPQKQLNDNDYMSMLRRFKETYHNIEVEIRLTNRIDRTKSGKFRYLVQKI